jgi:plastocyanin
VPARIDDRTLTLPRVARGVAVLALGLGALTACGSGSESSDAGTAAAGSTSEAPAATSSSAAGGTSAPGPAAAQTVTATEADFDITLDQDALAAGDYEITVVNNGRAGHDLVVEQDGEDIAGTETIPPGGSATLTVTLAAGEYVFYCSIANHRTMGMELTVQVS